MDTTLTRIHHTAPDATAVIADALLALWPRGRDLQVVCVGTDRSTGDAFGPLVGTALQAAGVDAHGTLDDPIGSSNLSRRVLAMRDGSAFLLAVDATLGHMEHVGLLSVRGGPVVPGAGVNKVLPPVGDACLLGCVNVGGFMEYFVLQNTRLHTVMQMAEVAAAGIILASARRALGEAAAAREVGAGV